MHHAASRGFDKGKILPSFVQSKIGMEIVQKLAPILARCKDDKKPPSLKRNLREPPFPQFLEIIRQIPTGELSRLGRGIVDLNPIRKLSIGVRQRRPIGWLDFRDEEVRPYD